MENDVLVLEELVLLPIRSYTPSFVVSESVSILLEKSVAKLPNQRQLVVQDRGGVKETDIRGIPRSQESSRSSRVSLRFCKFASFRFAA